ncbi:NAD-dependent epimerase/dehydratase family protein [Labedaea rhizosphaerae]|uniref:Nucleoside-diphosphate-sugar epimerase n=1 Tax=Labedaea rhizosphaerae TaxID=598644 RepID=A0A4R6SII4_LABRH|nr:NAD-dependent epimerase/dehydratase family protein [Labedaea rhizosphaerae]TDQ01410.1 nucleoside-diphosphate-sugar epimerase [Labedaea rhizosphaerae]
MRVLVFGGSGFVSGAVSRRFADRGHEVVAASRHGDLAVDRDQGLAALEGARFDAVVDVAWGGPGWVADALAAVSAAHWTFVSSMSVYDDDHLHDGQTATTAALVPPDPATYGGAKVIAERMVREALGEKAFVVRPGLVAGAGDRSDRYGYWPLRLSRGGRVAVPPLDELTQLIDVEDLAAWLVLATEQRLTGVYDAIGPASTLGEILARTAAGIDAPPHELVQATAGVNHYMGPRSLPLWAPMRGERLRAHDITPSLAAGLRLRPVEETAVAALAHERELGADRPRKAGLTPAEEAEVLARSGAPC